VREHLGEFLLNQYQSSSDRLSNRYLFITVAILGFMGILFELWPGIWLWRSKSRLHTGPEDQAMGGAAK
jgi:hypothetical protein